MKLKEYYYSLSDERKATFAKTIGTTTEYIRVHLIPKHRDPDRTPPLPRMQKIPKATGNKVSLDEVIKHFSKAGTK